MNGAAAVPPIMMIAPSSSRTRMIGVSHHFLLKRRKSQISRTKLRGARAACPAKSSWLDFGSCCVMVQARPSELPEVRRRVARLVVLDPVGRPRALYAAVQRIIPKEAHQHRDGRENQVIGRQEDQRGYGPADRIRRDHPS